MWLRPSPSHTNALQCLLLSLFLLLALLPSNVSARFCEGCTQGCCTQGCCPPYQGGPRPLPPSSDSHVLNLFFSTHWFFWCVVVAIILAILCAYSLWKKRRTLCGWGFNEHHTQSEGDSAGSCYAPPQYSRCNSFHHPPPPYTEVTSKPDLYPLVFTCNSDSGNGKGNGSSSYLMSQSDQHFRYMANSSSSLSDIFVNNSCVAGMLPDSGGAGSAFHGAESGSATQAASLNSLAMGGLGGSVTNAAGASGGSGTPVIYSNGCIQPNPLHSLENCCQPSAQVSGVSSLANIGTPGSPPQATSPTGEVREILDQIRQLQAGVSYEQLLLNGTGAKPRLQHTLSTPSNSQQVLQPILTTSASISGGTSGRSKKFFTSGSKTQPNKALYIPMAAIGGSGSGAQRCVLKSPVSSVVSGASFFVNRGRVARKGWITRSAPTTPGSALPPNRLGDDSPLLLNEHDEDAIDDDEDEEQEVDDRQRDHQETQRVHEDTDSETEAEARNHRRQHRHHRGHRGHRRGQLE
ncbi:anon-314 [Drosophila simulans]|uniref:WW domain binding protein VOPP1 n=1 Tax=Drosophila simulans TaxID=7240 RepID=B4R4E1_DROSI|nr:anon-314 [Drosophila simulans]